MNTEQRKTVWSILYSATEEENRIVKDIARANDISEICASLLYNRGYKSKESARDFLSFGDAVMHSPLILKDIEKAVARIKAAIDAHEKITIYGDYDVDGVTSVTMLYLYLSELGADVGYYIPNRAGEGYGLSRMAIDILAERGVSLIITVDTGITACDETDYAASLGIDVVVTDHHECQERIPDASAVVNPHRPDCPYPFKALAGVGVVFKLISAYEIIVCNGGENETEAIKKIYYNYADLAAIGTIADVMPLTDENRLIVKFGLSMLENTKRLGLAALIEAANGSSNPNVRPVASRAEHTHAPKKRKINSGYIGFAIAPRINAAGRISSASKAVELLLAEDAEIAATLAHELCEINYKRQLEENKIADSAYEKIERECDLENDKVIVISDNEWLQGVVGIVSSKITEKYGLPSILISFDGAICGEESGEDVGKGSGRSIKGINLVEAMSYSKEYLIKFGGHELAAGLTVRRRDVEKFRAKINEYANDILGKEDLYFSIEADRALEMSDLTMKLAKEITKLEPFGSMNSVPLFMIKKAKISRAYLIGGGRHTKLTLEKDGRSVNAVLFNRSYLNLGLKEGDLVDALFNLEINEYQNVESLQMIIQDIKLSEDYISYFEDERRLYADLCNGAKYQEEDGILPDREDFVAVYSVLRKEFRGGNDMMGETEIYHKIKSASKKPIRLAKLKFVLQILNELKICRVEEVCDGIYQYDIYFVAEKTSIDKSGILKKLKNQCQRK